MIKTLISTNNIAEECLTLAWRDAMPCWGGGLAEVEVAEAVVVGSPAVTEPVNCEEGWETGDDTEENSGEDGDTILLDAVDLTGVVLDGIEVPEWEELDGVPVTGELLGEAKVDELTEELDGTGVAGMLGRDEMYDPGEVELIAVLLSTLELWEGTGAQILLVTVTVSIPKMKESTLNF